MDSTESGLLTKTTTIDGESFPVYSIDGERWFSDPQQPAERAQRTAIFFKRELAELRRRFDQFLEMPIDDPRIYPRKVEREPEFLLWLGVVEQSMRDLQYRNPKIRRAAVRWFRSESTEIGSFAWVADLLGLDPEAVRRALTREEKATCLAR